MYTHTSSPCRFNKHPRACLAKPERFALSLLHANFWRAGEKSEASAWGLWEPQNNHWVHHQKMEVSPSNMGGCTIQNMCSLTILPSNMVICGSNLDAKKNGHGSISCEESDYACFALLTWKFTGRCAGKFWHMSQEKNHAARCPCRDLPGPSFWVSRALLALYSKNADGCAPVPSKCPSCMSSTGPLKPHCTHSLIAEPLARPVLTSKWINTSDIGIIKTTSQLR